MIYRTNAEFRRAISDKLNMEISLAAWESMAFIIFRHTIACHEPFTDLDVEMAVPRIQALLGLNKEL